MLFATNFQAYLVVAGSNMVIGDDTEESDELELEIDEVNFSASNSEKTLFLLASKELQRELQTPERYDCPIWTLGLERTFKVKIGLSLKRNCDIFHCRTQKVCFSFC